MMIQIAALTLTLAVAVPSAALAAGEVNTAVAARLDDLDLRRADHAALMLRRLETAAVRACGASAFSFRDYQDAVRRSDCYRESLNQAVTSLGAPLVTAAHQELAISLASR
jgi:UrcA family protein